MFTMSNAILGRSVEVDRRGEVSLSQAPLPIPAPAFARPSDMAMERMAAASGHVERALRAMESLHANYDRLADRIGPDKAVTAMRQAMSFLDRAEAERRRAEEAAFAESTPESP